MFSWFAGKGKNTPEDVTCWVPCPHGGFGSDHMFLSFEMGDGTVGEPAFGTRTVHRR